MGKMSKRRSEVALDSAIGALDQARAMLVKRLDELDLDAMRKRGTRLAVSVRDEARRRTQPRRRWISPWGVAGIAGLVVLGAAAIGAGYVAYDRERREAARKRLMGMQDGARARYVDARARYAELTGGRTRAEAELEARVRQAIGEGNGSIPQGLELAVEGRTVYLRGMVADPAAADAAAERIHGVPGVVAVVNLTTTAPSPQATPHP